MAAKISTIAQIDTKFNADSIEWCPVNPPYFVCGTYQLIEDTTTCNELKSSENNSRIGSMLLLKFDNVSKCLSHVQNISTEAITDMKWCSYNGTPLLGVTSSSGQFDLYSLVENNKGYKLENMSSFDVCSPNLSLSLDWCNSTVPRITISDSGGFASILRLAENGDEVSLDQK